MGAHLIIALALVTIGYAVVSKRLAGTSITPPMVFVSAGVLLSSGFLGVVDAELSPTMIHHLAEATLVLLLFSDASKIDVRKLFRRRSLPVRLLLIGLPLSVAFGVAMGLFLLPHWPFGSILALAAMLAPTDAALGQAIVEDERLPEGMRRGLGVESGLNDGVAVPVVVTGIALSSAVTAADADSWLTFTLLQVVLGPLVGFACGWLGGKLIERAEAKGWVDSAQRAIAGLALAALAYAVAESVGGNGFIAVFAAGMTVGASAPAACTNFHGFVSNEGQLLMMVVFVLVGGVYVVPAFAAASATHVIYAVLALTVMRIIPVLLSLVGSGMHVWSKLLVAWFGPRGIATVVFAIVAVESEHLPMKDEVFSIAIMTVTLSVFAHGITAVPAVKFFEKHCESKLSPDSPEHHISM